MKFGFFDDSKKEYVINSPKTPYPWINYLGNQGFFSLISNTAGGYCFYKDARLRRITRYRYNNVPIDMHVTATTTCLSIWADVISISTTTELSGIPAGHP